MKLAKDFQFNDGYFPAGTDVPWYYVYPFFLVHMLIFCGTGFLSVYAAKEPNPWFIYGFNGFAIFVSIRQTYWGLSTALSGHPLSVFYLLYIFDSTRDSGSLQCAFK